MIRIWIKILILLLLLAPTGAWASHIVGGEITYRYIGATLDSVRYEVSLTIYQDCENGQPDAILMDSPAFLAVYYISPAGLLAAKDTTIPDIEDIKVPTNFNNDCVTNVPRVCLLKKRFVKVFTLRKNTSGYVVSYQRCCRNGAINNVANPGDKGATFTCIIPPFLAGITNNSAVFNNYPPQIICLNNPLNYDHSATDPDGDSLSYEFCDALIGADPNDIKPNPPGPPPYLAVSFTSPFSPGQPMSGSPQIVIDPISGVISGTPNRIGRFLVSVCCHEWRNGVIINTVRREFQFVVTDCSKLVVACMPQYSTDINTYIVECASFTVNFDNCSQGGTTYHWDFGEPDTNADTSNLASPTYTYRDTGIYTVRLVVNPNSTCKDSISRFVKIYPYFRTNFDDTGLLCPGLPLSFFDSSTATIKPITSWFWNFGDGTTSNVQNPVHTFAYGGTFNVMLIAQNIKNCIDTTVKQVVIDNSRPVAGKDTIIVKGETIYFNATGGTNYVWTPSVYLNDGFIPNPVGYYPDTGRFQYSLSVTSAYGCTGYDTVRVWVVNKAAFYMPTAFTPNGDGRNDIYRPFAIGYRSLEYFRIYNRWGELVFLSQSLEYGWDGTYKGAKAEMGTYYWQLGYTDRFGKEGVMKGDMTLIR